MKIFFTSLFILMVLAVVWVNKSHHTAAPVVNTQAPPSPEEIMAHDYEKISRNLKKENTSSDEWKKINTYSLTPESIVTKENAKDFFKVAQANLPDINACLKKDFCGMAANNEDDAYFDDERTPAHILINRNLKVMRESLVKDGSLASEVDWNLMRELANSNSEMLSVEALDIISNFDKSHNKTDELVKMTQDLKGSAKAEALLKIAKSKNPQDKKVLENDVEEVFATADADTVINVLEKLRQMNFANNQKADLLKNLCRFKTDPEINHNWGMVVMNAKKIYAGFEKLCN
jgi:hypothetical protein